MQKSKAAGYTLIELMIVLVLIGIMVAWVTSQYRSHSKKANLMAAKGALIEDVNYLENFYSKYYSYTKQQRISGSSEKNCVWPELPKKQVANFRIQFEAKALCQVNSYLLYARPTESYQHKEHRYLKIDESSNVSLCEPNGENKSKDADKCSVF
ncbi:MAG: prepilin-type N-terminal cleavage/methylation domain-containing protein [Neisseriaceae bacterium]